MQRDLTNFSKIFDVLVLGGGVYGACVARLAARCGYSVALIERGDFGAGVSHNSLKIVHGGVRYVQHLDGARIRESVTAQRAWLRSAPHLVQPMRFVIPTYGWGSRGPAALGAGLALFHAVAGRRNRHLERRSRLPASGLLGRRALLSLRPELDRADLTGGAYWYDAQVLDANRLIFECIEDAVNHGAAAANHVEAVELRFGPHGVEGAVAEDRLTGAAIDIRARCTINATGPDVGRLLGRLPRQRGAVDELERTLVWTRNVNIVTRKLFDTQDAFGVGSRRASDAKVGRSKRLLFVAPWQDCSIVGTSHVQHGSGENLARAIEEDAEDLLADVNDALPGLGLEAGDIHYIHGGLTPAESEAARLKRSVIIDDEHIAGMPGLITVLGIKLTTAPVVAQRVVAHIARVIRKAPERAADTRCPLPGSVPQCRSDSAGVAGGDASADRSWAARVYGARAGRVLQALPGEGLSAEEHTFRCRVVYGIENEMVVRLRDAVFRATDLAERGRITSAQLDWCVGALASRYGWDAARCEAELQDVRPRLRLGESSAEVSARAAF